MIQLDIDPEIEQLVVQAARARGLEPSDYAGKIVASAVSPPEQDELSADELLHGLQALAEEATAVSNYPADFFTREVIYGDHD
jgi:hypothetical protein